MTFTSLDVDYTPSVLEETRRVMFGLDYDRDGRLAEAEYKAIADQHWPDRNGRARWWLDDMNDFA